MHLRKTRKWPDKFIKQLKCDMDVNVKFQLSCTVRQIPIPMLQLAITCALFINIDVTDAAEILEPPGGEKKNIMEGNNVTFRCIGVGHPPPLVQWSKVNGSLSDRVSISNMSMSTNEGNVTRVTVDLIFTGAYREDTGVYECTVSNLLNSVTQDTALIIQCKYVVSYVVRFNNA